ncbi:MAG: hypothetical protein KME26_03250 [Oscillatoria princeps RMCB-10]|nr:hypothetical protein [Oscillatoria princeps RMCB-10]
MSATAGQHGGECLSSKSLRNREPVGRITSSSGRLSASQRTGNLPRLDDMDSSNLKPLEIITAA